MAHTFETPPSVWLSDMEAGLLIHGKHTTYELVEKGIAEKSKLFPTTLWNVYELDAKIETENRIGWITYLTPHWGNFAFVINSNAVMRNGPIIYTTAVLLETAEFMYNVNEDYIEYLA